VSGEGGERGLSENVDSFLFPSFPMCGYVVWCNDDDDDDDDDDD
jgi:hypothetical protein